MRVDSFVAGFTGGSTLYKSNGQFYGGPYYTDRDIHNNVMTAEAYRANLDAYKHEALRRLMSPVLYNLTRLADGTITADCKQLSREEVLALRYEDMKQMAINWAALEFKLANRLPTYKHLDHVGYDLDYFASEYVQYQTRIRETLTGEEQTEALDKLDHLILSHVEKYAEQFADLVGGFLAQYGVGGEQTAIKESIVDLFRQRTAQYAQFVQENDNYAGIKGTADEWLLFDDMFMGEQLRYAFVSQQSDFTLTSSYGYSVDDLAAAGTLVKETWDVGYRKWQWGGYKHGSEVGFGVELGLAAMKYALIMDAFNVSDAMKAKLDTAFQNYIHAQNEEASQHVLRMRNDPYVRDKAAYALDWDKQLVLDIIGRMVTLLKSGDLNGAFQKDLLLIKEMYLSRAQSGTTSQQARYHPYSNSWLNKNYAGFWNQFIQRLSLSANKDLSPYMLSDQMSYLDIRG
jgi:hypothetical protein